MTDVQQRAAAKAFAAYWKGKGYEKGESQAFWLSLLRDVYGVEHPEQYISFEEQVHIDKSTGFIDGTIAATKVLIEQKGLGKNLNKGIKQSDGSFLTPFQQAKRYIMELPVSQHPRWVVTCNFSTFYVYDMEQPGGAPEIIELANLEQDYYRLGFLVSTEDTHIQKEMEVSIQAGELVGLLYDAFLQQYRDQESPESLKSLNVLCFRLVFCLYAEDAGVFGRRSMFHDYLAGYETGHMRQALIRLFQVLDTVPEERDPYLEPELAAFPYVNGGLFANEAIEIPHFTEEIRELLLTRASADFDWSAISPTIFGAVFESTLNPETRRKGGMHYTSIENIHKVIDPLFLDDLKTELKGILEITVDRDRKRKLRSYQKKLAELTFLDPACGSGNFLTETYLSLRKLENTVIAELMNQQISMGEVLDPIQVSISQFYGIEINDFAVTVAKTALWIAESQMMKATEAIVRMDLNFLPLTTNANIVEGNALRLDWEEVVPKSQLNYIMGNPPFVGKKEQNKEQKSDIFNLFGKQVKGVGNLDYVTGWYKKASDYIKQTSIHCAFVSTNSITQGEQPPVLWKALNENEIAIDFAYRTFRWDSEAKIKAHVHCVIIGFSVMPPKWKRLFSSTVEKKVEHINAYLLDAPDVLVESRNKPIYDVPEIVTGNQATDDGNFYIQMSEYADFVSSEPLAKKYLKLAYNGQGFINSKPQYCLWLVGVSPAELKKMPAVLQRVEKVRQFRLSSPKETTRSQAAIPTLFTEIRQPKGNYIVIPKVSSENRKYIPLGFLSPEVICNNTIKFVPNATLFHFGILSSNVHMSWMRTVAGRLEMRYQYSNKIVYNNFPWPDPTEAQKAKIEQTAQGILDARALYPDSSLADLYDDLTMPPELRRAHQQNDKAVWEAYGKAWKISSESECVAELMKLYQKKVENTP